MLVDEVTNYGEGSGHFNKHLKKLLEHSTGTLEAILMWEHGDSISKLIVQDSNVTETNIEI